MKRTKVKQTSEIARANSSSSDTSSSSGDSSSESEASKQSSGSESSSEESDNANAHASSSDDSDDDDIVDPSTSTKALGTSALTPSEDNSESSGTVQGDNVLVETTTFDSEVVSEEGRKVQISTTTSTTKKRTGAKPTPLAQLSALATADSHVSNAYVSYEYADRAYNDLSVTRGKGFTKEKNKKKRGSYRGGPIDISGGKGFKFDD